MPVFIVIANYFLLLVCTCCVVVVQATVVLSSFKKLENPEAGTDSFLAIESPLMSRKVASKIDCTIMCNALIGSDCAAVEFDEHSRMCTVGVGVVTVNGKKSGPTQNVFYARKAEDEPDDQTACENNPGFTYILHSSGEESACLHVSVETVRGDEAKEACESMAPGVGGRLYVTKTSARYDMLLDNRQGGEDIVWVGLRRTTSSNKFFWDDDGEELLPNSAMWNTLWNTDKDQPDFSDIQLCVGSQSGWIKFHDFECDMEGRYACEIPLPIE